jgi:hypothetical protein
VIPTPHVPRAWADELVLALRERDAGGSAIGDALVHVESFCADSGQSAHDAFGPAAEYAATLHLPPGAAGPTPVPAANVRVIVRYGTVVVAIFLASLSVSAWTRSVPLEIGSHHVAVGAVTVGSLVLAVRHLAAVKRWVVRRTVWSVVLSQLVLWGLVGVGLLAHWLYPPTVVALPAWPIAVLSGAALLMPAVSQLRRGDVPADDVLAGPFDNRTTTRRRNRNARVMIAWLPVAFAGVSIALTLLTDQLIFR